MASKRAISSVPCLARLVSPSPAPTLFASRRSSNVPVDVFLPSNSVRLAHSIPRPRNPSPFTQQPEEPISPTITTASSETPTANPTSSAADPTQPNQRTSTNNSNNNNPANVLQQPHYELTFTCRPCGTRSRHRVSKQGYHHGTVLIACPSCRNRHVIADHLRVFGDKATTVEDLLRARGEQVKRGTLAAEGDVEFWEDGTTTVREPLAAEREVKRAGEGKEEEQLPPGATFKSVKPGEN